MDSLTIDDSAEDAADKAELWRRGVLRWKYHPGQCVIDGAFSKSAVESKFFVAEVSRQLGKTVWAVTKANEVALQNPGCSIRIATAYFADIRSIILPAFTYVLQDCPADVMPKYRASEARFLYPNGADIILVGLDRNPEKIRGAKLRLVIIDEAAFGDSETLKYVVESVIIPAFTHEPEARCIFISTPPAEGTDHYFVTLADRLVMSGAYVKLTIDDNPLLTPLQVQQIADNMGGRQSIAFRREYLCERIIDVSRAIIPEFNAQRHVCVVPRPDYFKYLHRYESLDSGVRDKTVTLFGYYDFPKARLVIEQEFSLQNEQVTTRAIAAETRRVEGELAYDEEGILSVYRRTADNDNLILVQDLGTAEQIWFTPTDKDSLEAMVNHLRLLFADDRILIHPRCKLLTLTLASALWNKQRDAFARTDATGHADALSALIYLARNLDRHTNPFPPLYGVDVNNSFIPIAPKSRPTQAAKTFAEAFSEGKK